MKRWFSGVKNLALVLLLCTSLVAGGCEGTDTREKVDHTVEAVAGKKDLERYKQIQDNLGVIQTQQAEKYHQLDESADGK